MVFTHTFHLHYNCFTIFALTVNVINKCNYCVQNTLLGLEVCTHWRRHSSRKAFPNSLDPAVRICSCSVKRALVRLTVSAAAHHKAECETPPCCQMLKAALTDQHILDMWTTHLLCKFIQHARADRCRVSSEDVLLSFFYLPVVLVPEQQQHIR